MIPTLCTVEQKKLRYVCLVLGIYEALELRDGGSDYLGKGVSKVSVLWLCKVYHVSFLC